MLGLLGYWVRDGVRVRVGAAIRLILTISALVLSSVDCEANEIIGICIGAGNKAVVPMAGRVVVPNAFTGFFSFFTWWYSEECNCG